MKNVLIEVKELDVASPEKNIGKIFVDNEFRGIVCAELGNIHWYGCGINTWNCGIKLASYEEAKTHCINTLNALFNGVPKETSSCYQIELGELQKFVLTGYHCNYTTEERAAEILNIDIRTFRALVGNEQMFPLKERKRLVTIDKISLDELQKLVFCAYNYGEITLEKGMQILNVNKQEFFKSFDGWCIA